FSVFPSKYIEFNVVDGVLTGEVEITNESHDKIGFRMMTNTKDDYIVHPSSGFIPRGERALCTIQLKKNGNMDNIHTFMVNGHAAQDDDVDRKSFWEKLKEAHVVVHKLGLKHPKLNDRVLLERLAHQVRTLKNEIRNSKMIIDRQNKLITELRDVSGSCHHPSFIVVFIIACSSVFGVMLLVNRGMRESFYLEAIHPLL
ncbi:hypothetical protein PENTCL1PPCAC_17944, partial [Pristionchus entomophagus]